MSLKDNFNQAVKDFLKKDGMVGDDPFKGSVNTTQEDPSRSRNSYGTSYSDNLRAAASSYRQDPFAENDFDAPEDTPAGTYVPPRQPSGGYTPPTGNSFRGGRPPETPYYETEETTIISRNTRISGDISSFANVNVEGSVQGDIRLTKNISVSGKVVGNIECNNAVMAGAQMQGCITSKGQVQMDHDSVLLGNIDTQYLDLNGRIKGNVEVGGKAEFKNDAVIVGDITASTISVIDGAVIKGYVNTTFMQDSTTNVFPDAIVVGE